MSSLLDRVQKFFKSQKRRKILDYVGRYFIAAIAILFALYPVAWILSASLDPRNSMVNQKLIPDNATLDNFRDLLTNPVHPYMTWFWNTLKIATISAILTVFVGLLSAYAFSRFRFPGRRNLLLSVFLIQVFPNSLTMVATFLLIKAIGEFIPSMGLNSHGGLILIYLGGAMGINTWLMKGYLDSVPRDLDEAAKIDGASDWQIFWRVIVPLVRPIITVVALLSFIGSYADFLLPQILLQDTDKFTLAVGLTLFIRGGHYSQEWGVFAAGALIGAIPIIVIYLFLQDYLVSGLTAGAVKG
ncbi:MAG: ABC transporter permease subunit [Chitinivibrionales bacterium]|nr:ABC transporter permease subunit [Chitinivibrionales bacterium]